MKSFKITGGYTDYYEVTMGQAYFLKGNLHTQASFDYFFRKIPFGGGYVVFAGLQHLLEIIEDFRFEDKELDIFKQKGLDENYLDYLKGFRFNGNVFSIPEGELAFPNTPIVRVEGNIIETQIIETILLNFLNFHSLIATKASRMSEAAKGRILSDFGLRRAQGLGAIHASVAAVIGGFKSTSNIKSAVDFGTEVSGTMAHSYVQSQDDELTAFRNYADAHPDSCILLVDTYDTLKSGVPNAIKVARELKEKGKSLMAIRLDSGDLAYQAKKARRMLDEADFKEVKIVASNQLDEYVIKSLLDQGAPIDIFGVGTRLVTGDPDGALDGVYKLAFSDGKPRMKLSENLSKMTLPGRKKLYRIMGENGHFHGADLITLEEEDIPKRMFHPLDKEKNMDISSLRKDELLKKVMDNGKTLKKNQSIEDIASFSKDRLEKLPPEFKRFENPHVYKVGISPGLMELGDSLRKKFLSDL
ncbi:MAG: nicotinate phosphoribosyltransferase [Bacteroidales bacterium]